MVESEHDSDDGGIDLDVVELADEWRDDLTNFLDLPSFEGRPGLHPDYLDLENSTPITCFRLFIDEFTIKHLKSETNKNAAELAASPEHRNKAVVKSWKTVSLTEMKRFLLILLHMGVIKNPSYLTTGPLMNFLPWCLLLAFFRGTDSRLFCPCHISMTTKKFVGGRSPKL
ncbi:PiggyBac transposable element-derived protein 4 [Plakobranchus ocellatus]|uniref:PiggyBac transposable element-derived protein 4 n=1 Tax=Plakobranchus ocellatus TaxID=259542 RepID=A0AAV4DTL9_9GAST|nr:PiggyBac transposable element-derived protein 4 [Plakobranchus ocellatus]